MSPEGEIPPSIPEGCIFVGTTTLTNSTDALIILSYDTALPTPFPVGRPVCLPQPGVEKR